MTRNEFRKTVVELARKAAITQRTDTNYSFGYAACYIGEPGRLACHIVQARSFDGRQSDIFVNNRYLTTIFTR